VSSHEQQQENAEDDDSKEGDDPKNPKNEMACATNQSVMDDTINESDEQDEMHSGVGGYRLVG
jgi:hypothetical protein